MRTRLAFWLQLAAMIALLYLVLGDAFLLLWSRGAENSPDIQARGPWLLAMFVPTFAVLISVLTAWIAVTHARRDGVSPWPRAAVAVLCVVVIGACMYLLPFTVDWIWTVLNVVRLPLRRHLGLEGVVVLDAVALAVPLWLLFYARRSDLRGPA